MDLESSQLTSEAMWRSTLFITLIDAIVVTILARRINRSRFRQLKWPIVITAAIFWSVVGVVLYQVFWDDYYRYFASSWLHDGGVLVITIPMGAGLALLFHWLALRLPGNPIVSFCLLGGLKGLLEHLWGIYSLKILSIPLLQGVSPASILAFAFPEYIVYWCVVISLALLFQNGWRWWIGLRQMPTKAA
jgi:hypothetical protein